MRLQRKTEYDGLNMNKVMKDYTDGLHHDQVDKLKNRVEELEGENRELKDRLGKSRAKGGSKQALQDHLDKLTE